MTHRLRSPIRDLRRISHRRIACHRASLAVVILPLLFSVVSVSNAVASQAVRHRPVVLVIANFLTLDDLISAGPHVRKLVRDGAVGLMNTGTYPRSSISSRYLAVGAGARPVCASADVMGYDYDEAVSGISAGDVYALQTNRQAPESSVVCLGVARVVRANDSSLLAGSVGLLGEMFHSAGLRTAVVGNADVPDMPARYAPLVAMDARGLVDTGKVAHSVIRADSWFPGGLRDDLKNISALASSYIQSHGFIVVELGDLSRCEAMKYSLSEKAYTYYRRQGLEGLDRFIGSFRRTVEERDAVLILCSPNRQRLPEGIRSNLSPIVLFGRGLKPGLLTSATTRTRGLISNVDVAPTILEQAGLEIPDIGTGRPARVIASDETLPTLVRMERTAARSYSLRAPVLGTIGALAVVTGILTEIVLLRQTASDALRKVLRASLLVLLAVPASLLLADASPPTGLLGYLARLVTTIVLVLFASVAVARFGFRKSSRGDVALLAVLQFLTVALILTDLVTGTHLLKWSMTSCSHIVGIRYYGLGNEYMGVLLAMTVTSYALMLRLREDRTTAVFSRDWRSLFLAGVWFLVTAWAIGNPRLGANVGGFITSVASLGPALILASSRSFRFRHAVGLGLVACAVLALFTVSDALMPKEGTHLGRSVVSVHVLGTGYMWALISQKIAMHLRILRMGHTILFLLVGMPVFVMFARRLKTEGRLGRRADSFYAMGLPATLAGAAAALLFNDSGIVPAALIASIFVATAMYLRLGEGIS